MTKKKAGVLFVTSNSLVTLWPCLFRKDWPILTAGRRTLLPFACNLLQKVFEIEKAFARAEEAGAGMPLESIRSVLDTPLPSDLAPLLLHQSAEGLVALALSLAVAAVPPTIKISIDACSDRPILSLPAFAYFSKPKNDVGNWDRWRHRRTLQWRGIEHFADGDGELGNSKPLAAFEIKKLKVDESPNEVSTLYRHNRWKSPFENGDQNFFSAEVCCFVDVARVTAAALMAVRNNALQTTLNQHFLKNVLRDYQQSALENSLLMHKINLNNHKPRKNKIWSKKKLAKGDHEIERTN